MLLSIARAHGFLTGLAVALGVTALAAPAARPVGQVAARVPGFEQTQTWLRLVREHTAGGVDEAARTVAAWSPANLQRVQDDLQLIRLLVVTAARQATVPAAGSGDSQHSNLHAELRGRRLPFDRLAPLLGLPPAATNGPFAPADLGVPDSPVRRAIAKLMLQATLLHTDIGMAPPVEVRSPAGARMPPATAVRLNDGRELVVSSPAVHYGIAREAIALVMPATIGSPVGRQWYHATLAYLQAIRNYAVMMPHLETARTALPADARIWLASGAAHENLAAPAVQVAAEATGGTARIERPMILLSRAEQMLRQALVLDPGLDEARLRLGRVLDLSGRHEQGMVLLLQAEAGLESPVLRYYAALFAGRAADAAGQADTARRAYERAMALFPRAQSPRLAIAELAWRGADHANALSGVRVLFVTAGGDRTTDPWWVYDVSLVGDPMRQLNELWQAASEVQSR